MILQQGISSAINSVAAVTGLEYLVFEGRRISREISRKQEQAGTSQSAVIEDYSAHGLLEFQCDLSLPGVAKLAHLNCVVLSKCLFCFLTTFLFRELVLATP